MSLVNAGSAMSPTIDGKSVVHAVLSVFLGLPLVQLEGSSPLYWKDLTFQQQTKERRT
jgi:hypothetical protein